MSTYKEAGVDIDVAGEFVEKIRAIYPDIGGFSGLYPLGNQYLVASTDGVGTKLKIAIEMNCHHTIGIDLVGMCVNDILTAGAKPLFLLDYIATGKLELNQASEIIDGVIQGCKEAECILLGGETAQMPGFYDDGHYDIAGFTVGIVAKEDLIDGKTIKEGDVIVGLPSSGFHSNGFSLIRKIISERKISLKDFIEGKTIGEQLLIPTKIYVKEVMNVLKDVRVKGMAHITGGGMVENIPRIFPQGLGGIIKMGSWSIPPIFSWLKWIGNISDEEMFRTFNMGIGYVFITDPAEAKKIKNGYVIGEIQKGEGIKLV